MTRRRSPRRGQSTVELVLIVAMLAVGLLVAAYAFIPAFSEGADALGEDVGTLFGAGTRDGSGGMR